jgi:hypothetical protein
VYYGTKICGASNQRAKKTFGFEPRLRRVLPLTASPCVRLSRPRSTISQSDFHPVIEPSSLVACQALQARA